MRPVIFLMGPTAGGKTALAMEWLKHFPLEIISVDSTQVYRGLTIGSAKPSLEEQQIAPHRLIDIRDPSEPYSAYDFQQDALKEIADIHRKGRTPLLVGGTMLYFKSLTEGLAELPSADAKIRAAIEALAAEQGWQAVHEALKKIDPITAARLHPNDTQRVQRALEVYQITQTPLSQLIETQKKSQNTLMHKASSEHFPYNAAAFAVAPTDRQVLHQRIEARYRQMLAKGFVAEVEALYHRKDLTVDLPAIRSVGYRQVWSFLEGEYDYPSMVDKGIAATRQLAKRQLTWLRSWPDVDWINSTSSADLERSVKSLSNWLETHPARPH